MRRFALRKLEAVMHSRDIMEIQRVHSPAVWVSGLLDSGWRERLDERTRALMYMELTRSRWEA